MATAAVYLAGLAFIWSTATSQITNISASGGGAVVSTAEACKVQFTISYGYRRFFHWGDSLTERGGNSATLYFRVRASSDAHILLAPTSTIASTDPVYEVVLGAGKNSFSDIRRLQRTGTRATVQSKDLLSPTEVRGFWLRLWADGSIGVGREGDDTPFLGWKDPQPLPVRYFAFCTWNGVVGKWEYDCPRQDSDISDEEVEQIMTWPQKLRAGLFSSYDRYARPTAQHDARTVVYMHLSCMHVAVEEKNGVLSVYGTMSMHWRDEKLMWEPDSFGGLKQIHAASHELWLPEIILYNAADGKGDQLFTDTQVMIDSDGGVMWSPPAKLQVLCSLSLEAWPNDIHTCYLILGFWSFAELINLQLLENGTLLEMEDTGSQWTVVSLNASVVRFPHAWLLSSDDNVLTDRQGASVFVMDITIARISNVYYAILYVPVFALAMNILISLWISPWSRARLILCFTNQLISLLFMLVVNSRLPASAKYAPRLVVKCCGCLLLSTTVLLIGLLSKYMVWFLRPASPPTCFLNFMNGPLGTLLLIPPGTKEGRYGQMNDADEDGTINEFKSESTEESCETAGKLEWKRVGTVIDRIFFINFSVFIAIALTSSG